MKSNNNKLINRRNMIAILGAAGVTGIAGLSSFGKNLDKKGKNKTRPDNSGEVSETSKETKLKTIGVLGGIGPQATMDFELRVHQVAQRLIPPQQNAGYPPMIVFYHRHPPILVNEDFSAKLPIEPDPRFLEAAKKVGTAADFVVITSNGAHLLQELVEKAAGRKVLSMIGATLDEIRRRGWKKVGVLGLGEPRVYSQPLREMKIGCEMIDGELRAKLDAAIFKVMEGRIDDVAVAALRDAIRALRSKKVDGIVLGCTELPFLLPGNANDADLINPTQLLAEATVKFAMA
jgi:aspartate racemase